MRRKIIADDNILQLRNSQVMNRTTGFVFPEGILSKPIILDDTNMHRYNPEISRQLITQTKALTKMSQRRKSIASKEEDCNYFILYSHSQSDKLHLCEVIT